MFPEGKVVQKNDYQLEPLRWGVGKLIAAARDKSPFVVPFVHRGMEDVNPVGKYLWIPRVGHKVRVLFGPDMHFDDLFENYDRLCENNEGFEDPFPPSEELLHQQITETIRDKLESLQEELGKIQAQEPPVKKFLYGLIQVQEHH